MKLILNFFVLFPGSGSNLGLLFRGGQRQEPGQRQRGLRRDCSGDEPEEQLQGQRDHLHLLPDLVVRQQQLAHAQKYVKTQFTHCGEKKKVYALKESKKMIKQRVLIAKRKKNMMGRAEQ